MNWQKLLEIQGGLDEHIIDSKGLEGQELLDKKILALQVELGELANEWRGFKFWSDDQEAKTNQFCLHKLEWTNPLLEEYVDCLHFILSISLSLGITHEDIVVEDDLTGETVTETFNELFGYITALYTLKEVNIPASITFDDIQASVNELIECFVGLGEKHLGFSWDEVEKAYLDKNKINHARQENGY
ncbi:dUTP diphosphatase [Gracilibacillus dipsosauri]|uniref:dUTPase n=1 Tax=Gracilibacillus dipsosauri TaxID=178340 RepID=A0A317KY83_9BACI|nr:dUTP diphosphatase [Gracilibacillus dipsosauri]PWU68303.1 hypothetical protein DLJ74_07570 [Gracilibacillus dipsosauri]